MWFYIALTVLNALTLSIAILQLVVQCKSIKINSDLVNKSLSTIPPYTSESSHPVFADKRRRLEEQDSTNTSA